MRKKKTLKVSIQEIKKYCPFVKNIQLFCNNNDSKNNVVLSVMSNLCPIGKAINEKHLIVIDNKSKINIFKILRGSNVNSRNLMESFFKKCDTCDDACDACDNTTKPVQKSIEMNRKSFTCTQCEENAIGVINKHMDLNENRHDICVNNFEKPKDAYILFQDECNNDLKRHINNLFIDKRYRIFTVLNKLRKNYPNVYVENNTFFLSSFYEKYQQYGYKPCIGKGAYIIKNNFDDAFRNTNCKIRDITSFRSLTSCNGLNKSNIRILTKGEKEESNLYNWFDGNITNEKTVVWCSNDYLCLSNNEEVIDVGIETLKKIGNSSGGTRNISGSLLNHTHLEYILAKWFNKESALLFTSGYIANVGALETLGKLLNLIFVSDEMNHASIINGIKESRCEKHIFKHNDMVDLENLLKKLRGMKEYKNRKIMIVFESVYSMSGNISNIAHIVKLAKKYNALTYVDEVHAVGLYGKTGSGYAEELNLCDEIDIINGTLSKAIGSLGGFICANKYYIDVIRSYSSHFIFTTSLTPVNINTSAQAIHIIQNNLHLRNKFRDVVKKTKEELTKRGILIMENHSHIVVTLINSAEKCKQICDDLLTQYNIYIQPINYPTVPKGSERIRITPSPFHTDEHISKLADSLYVLFKKYQVNMFDKEKNKIAMAL
ncbi:delta-aminolevulinic acid synthetase (ALAS) [Plasmodium ovale wallikeri]|uniref:5-aminolevulinate synthase n=2 Tax=Plasmodium ovale TaxID=36330 RepID=A0A1A9A252_PLAOA|nr:delta-aminolevulinic acid synthetase (ALAS) [Plasmodium ovale wallikeri]SBT50571.1 delta-aminolevulinic acid synthetase (ALAS) [Plasmodium ovale wallikeri]SBT82777.1 delta-aminolevulinic acid synthetase, putative [Plasmodium ovale]